MRMKHKLDLIILKKRRYSENHEILEGGRYSAHLKLRYSENQ
jgi:hypothetical protein